MHFQHVVSALNVLPAGGPKFVGERDESPLLSTGTKMKGRLSQGIFTSFQSKGRIARIRALWGPVVDEHRDRVWDPSIPSDTPTRAFSTSESPICRLGDRPMPSLSRVAQHLLQPDTALARC